jgi:hypothetical protein
MKNFVIEKILHTYAPMNMGQSVPKRRPIKIQTQGNYADESIQHDDLRYCNDDESCISHCSIQTWCMPQLVCGCTKVSFFSNARYQLSDISHLLAKVVMTVKYTSLNKMFAFSASLKWVMFLYH